MITANSTATNYTTCITNGTTEISADVTPDKGGTGDYFRPHDLLCSAFASCLNITLCMIMQKKHLNYNNIQVRVDLDRSNLDKTVFLYDIELDADISQEEKASIITTAINCPVRKTLSKTLEFYALPDTDN